MYSFVLSFKNAIVALLCHIFCKYDLFRFIMLSALTDLRFYIVLSQTPKLSPVPLLLLVDRIKM